MSQSWPSYLLLKVFIYDVVALSLTTTTDHSSSSSSLMEKLIDVRPDSRTHGTLTLSRVGVCHQVFLFGLLWTVSKRLRSDWEPLMSSMGSNKNWFLLATSAVRDLSRVFLYSCPEASLSLISLFLLSLRIHFPSFLHQLINPQNPSWVLILIWISIFISPSSDVRFEPDLVYGLDVYNIFIKLI